MSLPLRTVEVAGVYARPGVEPPLGPSRLHLQDGRIARIEPLAQLPPEARHRIALPAPCNAHDHGRGLRTLAFGACDQSLELWLPALAREPKVDPYLRAAVGFARMAEGGVALANHCHNTQDGRALLQEAEAVSRAARDVGVRIAFAVPFAGRNSVVYGPLEPLLAHLPHGDHERLRRMRQPTRTLAENLALVEAIAALEHEGFQVQYGPVGPQWVDDEAMAAIARASADSGRRVHMHLFETQRQRRWADAEYKGGLLGHLDAIGLLSPRLTLAHAVWLDEADCALLAERGVTVSANVSSNLRLRSGMPAFGRWLDAGLRFGLGLDGMSLDDDEDMLRETRLAWHQLQASDRQDRFQPAQLFQALCVDGRRSIVGEDGGGVLQTGAPADMLVLDTQQIVRDRIAPDAPELLELVLARATKAHIHQLWVRGRCIVSDAACASVDLPSLEAALLDDARARHAAEPPDAPAIARLQRALRMHLGCC
ncbi:amidohydrolase family protein [Xylophilus rhododendri]|uniref:Amidohydrolase family protein n=1 Tax=Xylophilus rhododendri TaxID=2697032 RepID=A0A857J226_9BURK|nr:amidohydrolase family protein [Xylophilus rhododendri]QHI97776.1 amidohydrolase family protein [Xylophilus rhododendri]